MARPREFDRQKALRRAMETFWELGFEGASTAVLEKRMEIRRSSFYAAFGSKDDLYVEAMDQYIDDLRVRVMDRLRVGGPAMSVLKDFFFEVAGRGQPGSAPLRCCMVVRASLAGNSQFPEIRKRTRKALGELDDAFHGILKRARHEGKLPASTRLREASRFLTTTFQAMNIAALAGRSPRELRQIARNALSAIT